MAVEHEVAAADEARDELAATGELLRVRQADPGRDALGEVVARHGPESVAMFTGTQHNFAALTPLMARAWFRGTGSHKLFSTMTQGLTSWHISLSPVEMMT